MTEQQPVEAEVKAAFEIKDVTEKKISKNKKEYIRLQITAGDWFTCWTEKNPIFDERIPKAGEMWKGSINSTDPQWPVLSGLELIPETTPGHPNQAVLPKEEKVTESPKSEEDTNRAQAPAKPNKAAEKATGKPLTHGQIENRRQEYIIRQTCLKAAVESFNETTGTAQIITRASEFEEWVIRKIKK